MTDDEWVALVSTASAARPSPVRLVTYRNWIGSSWAFPAAFADASGAEYIVQSPHFGPDWARTLVTEQVVSALGRAIGAPLAEARLVDLPQELLDINRSMLEHLQAGVCHGSRQIANVAQSRFIHVDQPENRPRFALLAALYGWVVAADHQFLYELAPAQPGPLARPRDVPPGPLWLDGGDVGRGSGRRLRLCRVADCRPMNFGPPWSGSGTSRRQ